MFRRHLKRYTPLLSWYRKRVFGKPWDELNKQTLTWQKAVAGFSSANSTKVTGLSAGVVILVGKDASMLHQSMKSAAKAGFSVYLIGAHDNFSGCDGHFTSLSDFMATPPVVDWLAFINAGDQILSNAAAALRHAITANSLARSCPCDYYADKTRTPVFLPPWLVHSATPEAAYMRACFFHRSLLPKLHTPGDATSIISIVATLISGLTPEEIVPSGQLAFALSDQTNMVDGSFDIAASDISTTPSVTIIIPTRDNAELLSACIDSLISCTNYPDYKVLIIDNQSSEPDTLALFSTLQQHQQISVLRYDAPFNYAAINNWAAEQAEGELLVFLNDDVELETTSWLTDMVRYAQRDDVGAVGCKLLYGDRSIQHAGVAIGTLGGAAHKYKYLPEQMPGYFNELSSNHAVSAVTAACLVMRRRLFIALGGFDAKNLTVAFNDIDLCLKACEAGKINVVCNRVVHLHHESKSRGEDLTPEKAQRFTQEKAFMEKRWQLSTASDPFIHNGIQRRLNRRYSRSDKG